MAVHRVKNSFLGPSAVTTCLRCLLLAIVVTCSGETAAPQETGGEVVDKWLNGIHASRWPSVSGSNRSGLEVVCMTSIEAAWAGMTGHWCSFLDGYRLFCMLLFFVGGW